MSFRCTACGRVSSATGKDGLCLSPKCRNGKKLTGWEQNRKAVLATGCGIKEE